MKLMRTNYFRGTLLLCLILIAPAGAIAEEDVAEQTIIESGGFLHSVFFWLKNPENEEDRKAFEHHLTTFIDNSQYVKSKFIGTMAPSERDVVDSSYTYTLVVSFADKKDQDKYQTEPAHIKFVEDAQHLWEKVVVYDSFNTL